MFYEKAEILNITYPAEAEGWQSGVYHERVRKSDPVPNIDALCALRNADSSAQPVCSKANGGLLITSKMWTETESTGFGIYTYVEGPGFSFATGVRDAEFTLTVSNPSDKETKVSCYANDILKLNGEVLPAGASGIKLTFPICSVEDNVLLQIFVPTDAKVKKDAAVSELIVNDITYEYLPEKAPKAKPTLFLASDSTVQSYDQFHYHAGPVVQR